MTDKILDNYQLFRAKTLKDISRLSVYSHRELNLRLKEGKWSVNQILMHLLAVEKVVLSYIRKKAQAEKLERAGLKSWLRSKTLQLFLRMPLRYKSPPILPEPPTESDLDAIIQEFEKLRSEMEDFICKMPAKSKRNLIFRHPRAGMLTIRQTVDFLKEHWQHHKLQIERLEHTLLKHKLTQGK